MSQPTSRRSLVIGASSRIANELMAQSLAEDENLELYAVSRSEQSGLTGNRQNRLHWLQSDYSEQSMAEIVSRLLPFKGQFHRVFICNGILHNTDIFPEKRLQALKEQSFLQVMSVNALIPMLWIKYLEPLLKAKQDCVITVFSARIGSIEDNRSGGWYAYRASKAALNMLLKTAAIEYSRFNSNLRFLAFHPGTTDTPLSQPFQNSVPAGKLFMPEFVAHRLLSIIKDLPMQDPIQYLAWDGKTIAW